MMPSRPSRSLTLAALMLAAGPFSASAAEPLAPDSWSMQFSVQSDFTLASFQGSTLSLKRHLKSGNALRLGVSLNVSTRDDDFAQVTADTSRTRTATSAGNASAWSAGVGAYYLWYSRADTPLHAYWGAGPFVAWSHGDYENALVQTQVGPGPSTSTSTRIDDIENRGWQAGGSAALGVEWLVARRVGLFAEYVSSLAYNSMEQTRRSTSASSLSAPITETSDGDTRGWAFSGSGGRLGVSAYY